MNDLTPSSPKPVRDLLPEALLAEIAGRSAARDADRELPFDTIEALRKTRFGAARVSRKLGGFGLSWRETLELVLQLSEADSNVAHIWRNHLLLTERLVVNGPSNPATERLRSDIAKGALIGLAASDTGDGSPLVQDGDGYRFTTKKKYSTGAMYADWIVSYGVLPDGSRANLIIPKDREGITLVDDWNGMGQRLTGTGTTVFDNVHLSSDEVISFEDLAPNLMFMTSTVAQLVLTAVIAGIMAAVARDTRDLLRGRAGSRTFYYAPNADSTRDPLLLATLGERLAEAFAARAIVLEAADALDDAAAVIGGTADTLPAVEAAALAAAKAKVIVDAMAQRTASALFDVAGASATIRDLNLDRHWRNLRTVASHNPAVYKALVIGDHDVNGTPVPAMGLF